MSNWTALGRRVQVYVLASKAEYRLAIAQAGLIPLLIELLRGGGDEARATSAAHVTFKSRAALRRALSLRPEAIASALGPPTARPLPLRPAPAQSHKAS